MCTQGHFWLVLTVILTVILTTLNNTSQCFYQSKMVDSFYPRWNPLLVANDNLTWFTTNTLRRTGHVYLMIHVNGWLSPLQHELHVDCTYLQVLDVLNARLNPLLPAKDDLTRTFFLRNIMYINQLYHFNLESALCGVATLSSENKHVDNGVSSKLSFCENITQFSYHIECRKAVINSDHVFTAKKTFM